ncbi:MAG TPA: FkbM family methyltransferase [Smithellaceae bacterium]|jgi:FkbM family methyltransferase|nr:FkbM family methyltransferase [Smithella sp.]HOQ43150.1 FkbM family methyltransferase [Smithellaceae bacterium]HOE33998.1 FkbM family methyltransferase [Smithella sp.]HOG11077.1 FkbM family methyltransferase [Smithella sp.]HPH56208.1 FkbM family methyltransferase [Smithella sp.]
MSMLKKVFLRISGNRAVQGAIENKVQSLQELLGIGSGDGVLFSGEQAVFDILRQKFNPPYCIFDVGANQGQFLRLLLEHIAVDDFTVHCFEPGRETFKILVASLSDDRRIQLNNTGLGKEQGEAILHFDSAGSGLASLTKRNLDHFGIDFNQSENVKIDTIDHYCSENFIKHIHLLKIDVEGHELDVLAGAGRMFDEKSIDMVTFEFGGCNIDTRTFFRDFWHFFRKINMKIMRITPSGYFYPIESYREIYEQFRTTNFIAVSGNS